MSSNLVIVAIPARDEKVWKISSEQVPHMTLLFLGEKTEDVDKLSQIIDFVEHTVNVSEHGPCMLDVDERGTLGPDEADVLFFSKGYNVKWFNHLRNQLLQQNDIRTAYDSVEQYPEWTPHLTLGYPETPANEDEFPEHGLNWITFDRIAVWTEDFDGPEFKLTWPDRELGYDMAMSARNDELKKMGLDATIEHFGIKGMRWGVRGTNKQFAKSEKLMAEARTLEEKSMTKGRFGKKLLQRKALVKRRESAVLSDIVNKEVRDQVNKSAKKDLKELHKKPEFQNINYRDEKGHPQFDTEKFRALDKAESQVWTSHLNKVIKEKGYAFKAETNGNTWSLKPTIVVHASEEVLVVRPIRDKDGFVVDVEILDTTEESMKQSVELGAEFIEHHGVKGQKWGVRKQVPGPLGSHIRIDAETGKAKISKGATQGVVAAAVLFPLLSPLSLLHPRVKAEMKAAREVNKGVKADKKWLEAIDKSKKAVEVHNKAADEVNSKVAAFNNDKRWKNKDGTDIDLTKDPAKQKEYDTAVEKELLNPAYSRAALAVHGSKSPGGRYTFEIKDHTTAEFRVTDTFKKNQAEHAATDENELSVTFTILRDPVGHIVGFKPNEEDSMEQTAELGVEFIESRMIHNVEVGEAFILEHFGIKGMRWGFRRERPTPVAPTATSWVPHGSRRKTKIDVEGGENHPAHVDAIKVAEAQAKLKKSGPKALSNQELREVANRIQLENQVDVLTSSKGKRFVSRQFEIESQNLAREGLRTGVRVGFKKGIQRAAKVGAVAAI